jgi:hypothetical protein
MVPRLIYGYSGGKKNIRFRVWRQSIWIGIINDYSPRKIEMQKDRTVE